MEKQVLFSTITILFVLRLIIATGNIWLALKLPKTDNFKLYLDRIKRGTNLYFLAIALFGGIYSAFNLKASQQELQRLRKMHPELYK